MIRNTYGFLTAHVDQLRSFKNEVKDRYPWCSIIPTPWKDAKNQSGVASENGVASETETETEDDVIPTKKRTRELSSSSSDTQDHSRSIYKEYSCSESSNTFAASTC